MARKIVWELRISGVLFSSAAIPCDTLGHGERPSSSVWGEPGNGEGGIVRRRSFPLPSGP